MSAAKIHRTRKAHLNIFLFKTVFTGLRPAKSGKWEGLVLASAMFGLLNYG